MFMYSLPELSRHQHFSLFASGCLNFMKEIKHYRYNILSPCTQGYHLHTCF